MIREFIEAWRTSTSPEARELGYLYESIAIRERYRRCGDAWNAHLEHCHRAIELAISSTRGGTVMVLGSGLLLETPVETLLRRFDKVVLVDVVHPRAVQKKYAANEKVVLVEEDLLGISQELAAWTSGQPFPALRTPDLSHLKADFVISANCLSQLALMPRRRFEEIAGDKVSDVDLNTYSRAISKAHLKMIRDLKTPHLIIADFETRAFDQKRALVETSHPYFDAEDLFLKEEWIWKIAPRGEWDPDHDIEMSVGAFRLP